MEEHLKYMVPSFLLRKTLILIKNSIWKNGYLLDDKEMKGEFVS